MAGPAAAGKFLWEVVVSNIVRAVPIDEIDFIKRHEDEFRHVLDDPMHWRRVEDSDWLRYREIDGVKVGAVASLYQPNFSSFPINCKDMARLIEAKLAGRVDVIVIVFLKTRREYIRSAEAGAFHDQKLVGRPTIPGRKGDFWSLTEFEVEGKVSPL
jgi:hypothetical protein